MPTAFTVNGAACSYVLVGASGETRTGGPAPGPTSGSDVQAANDGSAGGGPEVGVRRNGAVPVAPVAGLPAGVGNPAGGGTASSSPTAGPPGGGTPGGTPAGGSPPAPSSPSSGSPTPIPSSAQPVPVQDSPAPPAKSSAPQPGGAPV
jgi:hypothetical protein